MLPTAANGPALALFSGPCIHCQKSNVRLSESRVNGLAKHNDIAPFERREARRWTRVSDYVVDVDPHVRESFEPSFGRARQSRADLRRASAKKVSRKSGLMERSARIRRAADATTTRGLVFGMCSDGGLTNCVASGDSFYLGGRTVRIAAIEAPQLYGAACPREAQLGRQSALKLQTLLNSGELQLTKPGQDLDRYGLLLRNVTVNGKDVGQAMTDARLAREIGDMTRSWC
jgi:hypothetical protein